jgi:hypothetical protein
VTQKIQKIGKKIKKVIQKIIKKIPFIFKFGRILRIIDEIGVTLTKNGL